MCIRDSLKAGDSAAANNARGCLAAMKEDYQTDKQYFEKAVACFQEIFLCTHLVATFDGC